MQKPQDEFEVKIGNAEIWYRGDNGKWVLAGIVLVIIALVVVVGKFGFGFLG